jgi:hypothetical protein
MHLFGKPLDDQESQLGALLIAEFFHNFRGVVKGLSRPKK